MPILKIFTCIQQHRIYQLSDTSLYQRLSRTFKRPLCPWTGLWEKNNNNNNETNTDTNAGAHSDQGYLLGKKKVCTPKCPVSYVKKKKNTHTKKQKNNKKKCKWFFYQTAKHPFASHATSRRFPILYIYIRSGWQALLIRESLCMF